MANQGIPLDIEIIFKEVLVNESHKVWMKRNGMGWNDKEKNDFSCEYDRDEGKGRNFRRDIKRKDRCYGCYGGRE